MKTAKITIKSPSGEHTDEAFGNTFRTALSAGHALGRQLAMELSEIHGVDIDYVVKCGPYSEMRTFHNEEPT